MPALTYNGLPSLSELLVVDIETVPQYPQYDDMPDNWKILWQEKMSKVFGEEITLAQGYDLRGSILAEFGRIICISSGYFYQDDAGCWCFRIKSFYGDNEAELIKKFLEAAEQYNKVQKNMLFAGHNIQEFDIPYICRRSIVHSLHLPHCLQLYGRKPWQVNMLDTMQFWKFGDYKNFISLNLLASVVNVPTSKIDINGGQVQDVYYKDKDLLRIVKYCQRDIVTTANIILRFKKLPLLQSENVNSTNDLADTTGI
jgi:DNA polymerase elongation subunit (family B)